MYSKMVFMNISFAKFGGFQLIRRQLVLVFRRKEEEYKQSELRNQSTSQK